MNNRILILILGILAGGAGAYFLAKSGNTPAAAEDAGKPPVTVTTSAPKAPASPRKKETPEATEPAPAKPAATSAWAKLAEKFGAAKTEKSKKITKDVADLIDQGMELANFAATTNGAGSVAELASREAMKNLAGQLGLSEEQQGKASELIKGSVTQRMNAMTELASALRSDPEQMMDLFLSGDALATNAITQDEYNQRTQATRTMLENIGGFVMGRPGAAGTQIFGDEEFVKQLNAILTPEQQAKFTELANQMTQQTESNNGRRRGGGMNFLQNGQIPAMELDKLDKSVTAIKSFANGAKLMMEAGRNLRDAAPNAGGNSGAQPN